MWPFFLVCTLTIAKCFECVISIYVLLCDDRIIPFLSTRQPLKANTRGPRISCGKGRLFESCSMGPSRVKEEKAQNLNIEGKSTTSKQTNALGSIASCTKVAFFIFKESETKKLFLIQVFQINIYGKACGIPRP